MCLIWERTIYVFPMVFSRGCLLSCMLLHSFLVLVTLQLYIRSLQQPFQYNSPGFLYIQIKHTIYFIPGCFPRNAAEKLMDESYQVPQPVPWEREAPFTRELYHDVSPNGAQRFHCLDPWHTIHLGVGKHWIGCGAFMLQKLLPMGTLEQRIAEIGSQYKTFCRENKLDPVIRTIDLRTFGGTAAPLGSWNKAAVTSNMMQFFESFCDQWSDSIRGNEQLENWASFLQPKCHAMVFDGFCF